MTEPSTKLHLIANSTEQLERQALQQMKAELPKASEAPKGYVAPPESLV